MHTYKVVENWMLMKCQTICLLYTQARLKVNYKITNCLLLTTMRKTRNSIAFTSFWTYTHTRAKKVFNSKLCEELQFFKLTATWLFGLPTRAHTYEHTKHHLHWNAHFDIWYGAQKYATMAKVKVNGRHGKKVVSRKKWSEEAEEREWVK